MFKQTKAFSSFSVNDLEKAKKFYGEILKLDVTENDMGLLELQIGDGNIVLVYPKPSHTPATFTILNFPVADIDNAVDELTQLNVVFERYDDIDLKTDEKGICRGIPNIAWFKDSAGNILSVVEQK